MINNKLLAGITFLISGTIIELAILFIGAICIDYTTVYVESVGRLWQTIDNMKLVLPFVVGSLFMVLGVLFILFGAFINRYSPKGD